MYTVIVKCSLGLNEKHYFDTYQEALLFQKDCWKCGDIAVIKKGEVL